METLIAAHSGADGRPDNSLEFVACALECGRSCLPENIGNCSGVLRIRRA